MHMPAGILFHCCLSSGRARLISCVCGLLCSCTVTTLPGVLGEGPCQAAAWLPVWWHARDRHCLGSDPLGGRIWGRHCSCLPGLKLGIPFFLLILMWTMYVSGSYNFIIISNALLVVTCFS